MANSGIFGYYPLDRALLRDREKSLSVKNTYPLTTEEFFFLEYQTKYLASA